MIRVGDKVYHFMNMNRIGEVLELITKTNKTWMVGGTMSENPFVKIKFDDKTETLPLQDLMKVDP